MCSALEQLAHRRAFLGLDQEHAEIAQRMPRPASAAGATTRLIAIGRPGPAAPPRPRPAPPRRGSNRSTTRKGRRPCRPRRRRCRRRCRRWSRVAGVVFGDAGFDLAHQVGADVGGLGVDAAAHAGEQRLQRRAHAERERDVVMVTSGQPPARNTCVSRKNQPAEPSSRAKPVTHRPITAPARNATLQAGVQRFLQALAVRAEALVAVFMP
jgi:hypothetical protein